MIEHQVRGGYYAWIIPACYAGQGENEDVGVLSLQAQDFEAGEEQNKTVMKVAEDEKVVNDQSDNGDDYVSKFGQLVEGEIQLADEVDIARNNTDES